MNKVSSIILLVLIFSSLACKDKKTGTPEYIHQEIPQDFIEFYDQFCKDSLYQMDHIIFPLDGKSAEDSLLNKPYTWHKEQWKIHGPYDDMGGTFTQRWYNVNSVVIDKISDSSGQFTMERRWAKIGSEWHLIYYKEMGR